MQNNIPRLDFSALAGVQANDNPHTPAEPQTPDAQVHTPPADGYQTPPQQRLMTPQTPPRLERNSDAQFDPFNLDPFRDNRDIHEALMDTLRRNMAADQVHTPTGQRISTPENPPPLRRRQPVSWFNDTRSPVSARELFTRQPKERKHSEILGDRGQQSCNPKGVDFEFPGRQEPPGGNGAPIVI